MVRCEDSSSAGRLPELRLQSGASGLCPRQAVLVLAQDGGRLCLHEGSGVLEESKEGCTGAQPGWRVRDPMPLSISDSRGT
jgi:hypothetical protein